MRALIVQLSFGADGPSGIGRGATPDGDGSGDVREHNDGMFWTRADGSGDVDFLGGGSWGEHAEATLCVL